MSYLKRPKIKGQITRSHLRSKKQEREIAKKIGGRLTPSSGSGVLKGDVRLKRVVRIEAKTTKNRSFSVTREMVSKLEEACLPYDELPILVVEFITEEGKKISELAVCPIYVLETIAGIQRIQ